MRTNNFALATLTIAGSCCFAATVRAAGPETEPEPLVAEGTLVESCGWPTVVALKSSTLGTATTGVLVHPKIVLTLGSAQTITEGTQVSFGDHRNVGANYVGLDGPCVPHPDHSIGLEGPFGKNIAYCKLADAVMLPATPVAFGCEMDLLVAGQDITAVGFDGCEGCGSSVRDKTWGTPTLRSVDRADNTAVVGPGPGTPCQGNAIGFVQLEDGTWRAWGANSDFEEGGGCGAEVTMTMFAGVVKWIEEDSGIDITPCHDADGTWNPTEECTEFLTGDASGGESTWPEGCEELPRSGPGESSCAEAEETGDADTGDEAAGDSDGAPAGCGCSAPGASPSGLWTLLVLGLLRRRQTDRADTVR